MIIMNPNKISPAKLRIIIYSAKFLYKKTKIFGYLDFLH